MKEYLKKKNHVNLPDPLGNLDITKVLLDQGEIIVSPAPPPARFGEVSIHEECSAKTIRVQAVECVGTIDSIYTTQIGKRFRLRNDLLEGSVNESFLVIVKQYGIAMEDTTRQALKNFLDSPNREVHLSVPHAAEQYMKRSHLLTVSSLPSPLLQATVP